MYKLCSQIEIVVKDSNLDSQMEVTEINHNKRFSEVLSNAKCPRCNLMIRKLLHMLEIITISGANIVGTNGLEAGVQV